VVYAGDLNGDVYAVTTDGTVLWTTHVTGRVSASIAVIRNTLVFGDLAGYIYGLDPRSGDIRWKIRPNPHPIAAILRPATRASTSRTSLKYRGSTTGAASGLLLEIRTVPRLNGCITADAIE
jgi:PQQ-like domain